MGCRRSTSENVDREHCLTLSCHSPVSIFNLEVLEEGFEVVLGGEAGVGEVAGGVVPFAEAAVVEEFEFFRDDEGDDVVGQTFFEEDEPSHSAVAILEGMDFLKFLVKVEQVLQILFLF